MKHCDIKRCTQETTIVYLTICAEGHVDEYYLCDQHALNVWATDHGTGCTCIYMHPVVDHMAATVKGEDPDDFRFYLGQWVAVRDGKVIKHGETPEKLIDYAQRHQLAGTNVFEVKKEHMGGLV